MLSVTLFIVQTSIYRCKHSECMCVYRMKNVPADSHTSPQQEDQSSSDEDMSPELKGNESTFLCVIYFTQLAI